MTRFVRKRASWIAAFVGLYALIGLLKFGYKYLDSAAGGAAATWLSPFIEELAGAFGGLLLLPLIVWTARRFRPQESGWLEAGLGHLGACVAYSLLHTTWNGFSRMALFPLAGLGEYDYGAWSIRYWMELPNDLITYAFTVIAVTAWFLWQERRETSEEQAPARPRTLLVRSGQSAALIPFDKIDWAQAARNYTEIRSGGRTYLLRGGLTALEEQMDEDDFVRLNRSALVRVDFIDRMRGADHGELEVTLRDGTKLLWTRRYRERSRGLILETL